MSVEYLISFDPGRRKRPYLVEPDWSTVTTEEGGINPWPREFKTLVEAREFVDRRKEDRRKAIEAARRIQLVERR